MKTLSVHHHLVSIVRIQRQRITSIVRSQRQMTTSARSSEHTLASTCSQDFTKPSRNISQSRVRKRMVLATFLHDKLTIPEKCSVCIVLATMQLKNTPAPLRVPWKVPWTPFPVDVPFACNRPATGVFSYRFTGLRLLELGFSSVDVVLEFCVGQ